MRVEHNYLKELLDEEVRVFGHPVEDIQKELAKRGETCDESAKEFYAQLTERMNALSDADHTYKRAAGLCMSVSAFKSLANLAHELAARVGMDYALDRIQHYGTFTFTIQYFELFKSESPELNESFSLLLSRADQISLAPVRRYNRNLIELSLTYDLDE